MVVQHKQATGNVVKSPLRKMLRANGIFLSRLLTDHFTGVKWSLYDLLGSFPVLQILF